MYDPNQPVNPVMESDGNGGLELSCMGMTLRQHYAGLAMQGLLANPNVIGASVSLDVQVTALARLIEASAYAMADVMMQGGASNPVVMSDVMPVQAHGVVDPLTLEITSLLKGIQPNDTCPRIECDGRMVAFTNHGTQTTRLTCNVCKCWCPYHG